MSPCVCVCVTTGDNWSVVFRTTRMWHLQRQRCSILNGVSSSSLFIFFFIFFVSSSSLLCLRRPLRRHYWPVQLRPQDVALCRRLATGRRLDHVDTRFACPHSSRLVLGRPSRAKSRERSRPTWYQLRWWRVRVRSEPGKYEAMKSITDLRKIKLIFHSHTVYIFIIYMIYIYIYICVFVCVCVCVYLLIFLSE